MTTISLIERCKELIPARFIIVVMIFFSIFFSYMLRGNMSIAITAMTDAQESGGNETTLPDYGPRYNWPAFEQGILLGSYYYGYLISNLPGGYLSEIIGARRLLGYSSIVCAVLTMLTPVMAPIFWLSFFSRFLIGIFGGFGFPVGQSLIAKWAPPNEKTKFISAFSGGSLGTVVSWPICGLIIETIGWPSVFYVTGGLSLGFAGVWFLFTYDSPQQHPRISDKEREYVESKIGGVSKSAKLVPPYFKMFTSIPFWSLLILHFGNTWGLYFVLTATPKFVNEVLGFEIGNTGILSMVPSLCRMVMMIVFGFVGDYCRSKKWFRSITWERKTFTILSHIMPGIFLITIICVNTDPYLCIAFMGLSSAFNGAIVLTSMQNSQDLAPNYAATIYGIINAVGTTPGFISPLVVAYFTQENNTIKEWESIFIIGGVIYIVPALIFMVIGSGERQPWNEPNEKSANIEPIERETEEVVNLGIDKNEKVDRKEI